MKYDEPGDARLYLKNGIFRWGDKVVKVVQVHDDMMVDVHILDDMSGGRCHVNDLNLTPLKVGYYYDQDYRCSIFVERLPIRGWRQGLLNQNCRAKGNRSWNLNLTSSFVKMLKNVYVPVDEAYKKARRLKKSYPFHRLWTVDNFGILRYKESVVGEWNPDSYHLMESYKFLTELLEEALGNETYRHRSC